MTTEDTLPTVMVVEDNLDCIHLWYRYGEVAGCRVVSAAVGEEALPLARCEKPALVLLDIMLPGMSGWEVLACLKADPSTRGIPIVMCSALDEQANARELGADGYLRKPVRFHDFLAWLQATAQVSVPAYPSES
jgi:CheY-like chemotaxis protein